ncbi:hypothetical protein M3182_02460 [Mesobacillus maritimus]|uniref:hypothetical protein n=1 Tax=Mesobacillus maritimus TaxID=1643336 RepID=UPI00203C875C|nr:hypothetical protein [Mesobacillus maritimus]MCM3584604.1 hypothetical protein [Mesobacillus maritimus]MCM3671419.1 hypothetical protein [Mesobacillus maritimus]
MKKWWRKKKAKRITNKKHSDHYTFIDFLFDVLFYIPELILFPLRMIWWLIRGFGRLVGNLFDAI